MVGALVVVVIGFQYVFPVKHALQATARQQQQ
jgi:hypothetical protein